MRTELVTQLIWNFTFKILEAVLSMWEMPS